MYGGVWPETEAGNTVSLPCDGGTVTRECSPDNGGQWLTPDDRQCATPTTPSTQPPTIPNGEQQPPFDLGMYYTTFSFRVLLPI